MEQTTLDGIEAITAKDTWTMEDCAELLELLAAGADAPGKLHRILGELESANPDPRGAAALKIGMARYMISHFGDALDVLASATDNKDRHWVQALCCKELQRYSQALEEVRRAGDRGWDADEVAMQAIELQALAGDVEAADGALAAVEAQAGKTARYAYVRGLIDDLNGLHDRAHEAYLRAREIDPAHSGATFHLAYNCDLHGDEEQALELYKECLTRQPIHANVLLNMAVLYEDLGDYDAAEACLRKILTANPLHERAGLFLKDVVAAKTMYFDEDQARRIAKRNAVLDIPVTDFELSVRARNCLKKMNIRCLGDLVMTTETELLAYKNFGETSLREIKEMLTAKGLHLGQGLEGDDVFQQSPTAEQVRAGNEGVLATPLERIELSIRARAALEGLRIATLGDLTHRTEAELLACKNFGQSSLNEVRQRLAEYDLRLRETN